MADPVDVGTTEDLVAFTLRIENATGVTGFGLSTFDWGGAWLHRDLRHASSALLSGAGGHHTRSGRPRRAQQLRHRNR